MNACDGILLCDDLIFTSRIVGTAKAAGFNVRAVKTPAELLILARQQAPRCVMMDLHVEGLNVARMVPDLSLVSRPFLVGYGSHVDVATLKAARDAGCDVVWPRSKFVDELTTALPDWFKPRETDS